MAYLEFDSVREGGRLIRGSGRQGGSGCFMSAHAGGLIHIKLFKPMRSVLGVFILKA